MSSFYQLKVLSGLAFLLLLTVLLTACGAPEGKALVLPADCVPEDFHFVGQKLVLLDVPEAKLGQRLYGLKNISPQNIELAHVKPTPEMSVGSASKLLPQHWSALALMSGDFSVSCRDLDSEKHNVLSCQDVLLVCRFTHVALTGEKKSAYWVVENLSNRRLLAAIVERGIKLKGWEK
jgi:hypothetical protein